MELNSIWLWAATAASLGCWGVHTFVGGRQIVSPLMASNLEPMPKYVLYFVWHIATLAIAFIAIGFALAALYPGLWPLGINSAALSLLIALLIFGVAVSRKMSFGDMPQWTVFLVMALLGAGAIWL